VTSFFVLFCAFLQHLSNTSRASNLLESVFGPDADTLNFNRDMEVIGKMMTFNGNRNDIALGMAENEPNKPPRRCPGYANAMSIIIYLVDRFAPCAECLDAANAISEERLVEIHRKETLFQKFVLKMGQLTYNENNKYFPHASEVKHPMDCNGRKLGSLRIPAAGDRYIPVYGKCFHSIDFDSAGLGSLSMELHLPTLHFRRRGCGDDPKLQGQTDIHGVEDHTYH